MISGVSRHFVSAGLASVFVAPAVHAAEWSLTGNASTSAGADHNPQLQLDGVGTRSSFVFNAGAELIGTTATTALSLAQSLRIARYPAERELNSEQAGLDAGYAMSGERWNLALSASANRESTLTSELGTTGITDINANRDSGTLGLNSRRRFTERLSVGGGLGYQRTAYPGLDDSTGLYGSDNATGSMNIRYGVSPTMSLTFAGSASAFDSQRQGGSSKSQNLTARLDYAVAERLTLALSAGPSRVATGQRVAHGIVYTASLQRSNPRSSFAAAASRSIPPSGAGVLTRTDSVNLSWSRQMTERTRVDLGLGAVSSSAVSSAPGSTVSDVRYLRATATMRRQLGEQWSIALAATGARQYVRQQDQKANGYDASLTINWSSRNHVF